MKIASMVPSWTETLIECGADVTARTRFCIHPREEVAKVSVVGGTKDIDWRKLVESGSQLLVLDREENPRRMADASPVPWHATHITCAADVTTELRSLAAWLATHPGSDPDVNQKLSALADRWKAALETADHVLDRLGPPSWNQIPGVRHWIREPEGFDRQPREGMNIVYMIWRDPWIAVAPQTFIGSMLAALGLEGLLMKSEERYPHLDLSVLDPERTVLLFSSEPYPFHQKIAELASLPFAAALVDGEAFSWFGTRSLRFLESASEYRSRRCP